MRTSITITAKSSFSSCFSAILAGRGRDHLTPKRLQHGPQRHEALGLVVDDEDRARAAHPARFL
jgi:hypothetical protein